MNNTGNFAESTPPPRSMLPVIAQIQSLADKFPAQVNREFSNLLQGIFLDKQGNYRSIADTRRISSIGRR
jgi:hypothetical protein